MLIEVDETLFPALEKEGLLVQDETGQQYVIVTKLLILKKKPKNG